MFTPLRALRDNPALPLPLLTTIIEAPIAVALIPTPRAAAPIPNLLTAAAVPTLVLPAVVAALIPNLPVAAVTIHHREVLLLQAAVPRAALPQVVLLREVFLLQVREATPTHREVILPHREVIPHPHPTALQAEVTEATNAITT